MMELQTNNTRDLLSDYGSEVMALVQRNETEKLCKLTDDAHSELLSIIRAKIAEVENQYFGDITRWYAYEEARKDFLALFDTDKEVK